MSDGTWNTAVMDPADVCRLIKDMREQVESVSGTLDVLRAGLTQLEAKVLAIPLPFETPAGEDSVSDVSSQPADTHVPEVSMDGDSAVEAQTDESPTAEASAPWQSEVETPAVEAQTDESATAEASAPWQSEVETPAVEAQTDETPWVEAPAAWQAPSEVVGPEAETSEPQSTDAPMAEAPTSEPEATSVDEPAAEASDVEPPAEPSPEPSWLAASAALDSIWAQEAEAAASDEARKPSLTGWPDESIWSPSYEWKPAAQRPVEDSTPAEAEPAANADATSQVEATHTQPHVARERYVDNSWLTSSADTSFWPSTAEQKPEAPRDAVRDEVAKTVSEVRDDLATAEPGSEASSGPMISAGLSAAIDDEATRRDEVARAVARMRAELGYGPPVPPESAVDETAPADEAGASTAEVDEDAARREEIARAIAQLREETDGDGEPEDVALGAASEQSDPSSEVALPHEAEATPDEEAVREEVRRAVEAARAELSGGLSAMMAPPAPATANTRFSLSDWTVEQDRDGPPVIVIKDADGRVELAHVYEALNRVSCGDSAALLNYTPHSVTIGLPVRAVIPDDEHLASAFESVFGRPCRIQSDGVRISVSMGSEHGRNEEAA